MLSQSGSNRWWSNLSLELSPVAGLSSQHAGKSSSALKQSTAVPGEALSSFHTNSSDVTGLVFQAEFLRVLEKDDSVGEFRKVFEADSVRDEDNEPKAIELAAWSKIESEQRILDRQNISSRSVNTQQFPSDTFIAPLGYVWDSLTQAEMPFSAQNSSMLGADKAPVTIRREKGDHQDRSVEVKDGEVRYLRASESAGEEGIAFDSMQSIVQDLSELQQTLDAVLQSNMRGHYGAVEAGLSGVADRSLDSRSTGAPNGEDGTAVGENSAVDENRGVAGNSVGEGSASSSTYKSRSSPSAFNEGSRLQVAGYVHRIVQRVMQAFPSPSAGTSQSSRGEVFSVRLHPEAVGPTQLSIRAELGAIYALFQVETSTAKELLLQSMDLLRDQLQKQGTELKQFEVLVSPKEQWLGHSGGMDSREKSNDESYRSLERRYAELTDNRIGRDADGSEPESIERYVSMLFRNGNNIDYSC